MRVGPGADEVGAVDFKADKFRGPADESHIVDLKFGPSAPERARWVAGYAHV